MDVVISAQENLELKNCKKCVFDLKCHLLIHKHWIVRNAPE